VISHRDSPGENIWFDSVAGLAALNDIPVLTPDDPNTPIIVERVRECRPDWLFSFYYRLLLKAELLELPSRGAFNMHGSLLPRYRGRAPTNWAIINGEPETGVSLHRMVAKPDAGNLVDQMAVAILPNDTALEVFHKVTLAAETVMLRSLPGLIDGSIRETPLNLAAGSYYGGRKPADGRIDPHWPAQRIHNLVRAVAPPYPGAFVETETPSRHCRIDLLGSYFRQDPAQAPTPRLYWQGDRLWLDCSDGRRLQILAAAVDGARLDQDSFRQRFGHQLLLTDAPVTQSAGL